MNSDKLKAACLATTLAAALVTGSVTQAAITIETVPVGDAGNTADTAAHSGNPGGQGAVPYAYNIGKYEVTAGQYTEFLNAVAATDTYALYNTYMSRTDWGSGIARAGSPGSYSYSVDSAFVNRPVNYVCFGDAIRFANWLHNDQPTGMQDASTTEDGAYFVNGATSDFALLGVWRDGGAAWAVPSEDEWYKAAYYKGGSLNAGYYLYPTSSDTAPGQDMTDASGNNANYVPPPNSVYPIDAPYYTTLAGEFQDSDSPYGTFDQAGNLWEVNEAIRGSYRGLRGGSLGSVLSSDLQSTYRDSVAWPTSEGFIFGFRVVQLPEPGSIVMLSLAGLILQRRVRTCVRP